MTPEQQREWVEYVTRWQEWVCDPSRPFPSARELRPEQVDDRLRRKA